MSSPIDRLIGGQAAGKERVSDGAPEQRSVSVVSPGQVDPGRKPINECSLEEAVWLLANPGMMPDPDDLSPKEVRAVTRFIATAFAFLRCADPRKPYAPVLQAALDALEREYPCIPKNYRWWFGEEGINDGKSAGEA